MKFIGAHVDCPSDLARTPFMAAELGADAFAINLTDPSRWRSPAIDTSTAEAFRRACDECGFTPDRILPHAGFVINLGSPEPRKLKLSQLALADEFDRAARLGLTMVNFHPGAHLKKLTDDECLLRIAASLDKVLATSPDTVTAVLENTAGQGSSVGYTFAQLARIIDTMELPDRVGVCIDTAHAFAAGYDLSTPEGFDAMCDEFERLIGFGRLRGMHLNDSQRPLASRIDRHASIGKGLIGAEAFRRIMADPRFDGIPLILETPDPALWKDEVALLRQWAS